MCILYPFCVVILYQYFRWHCSFLVEFCTYFVYKIRTLDAKMYIHFVYLDVNFVYTKCTFKAPFCTWILYRFCVVILYTHFVCTFCIQNMYRGGFPDVLYKSSHRETICKLEVKLYHCEGDSDPPSAGAGGREFCAQQ